jgi:hypothetical protein
MQSIPWSGEIVNKPGIYRGIPLADYHRFDLCDAPSVSSSFLRTLINKSPKHAWEESALNPEHPDDEAESEAIAKGRAVHKAVAAEPFDDDTVLRPPTIAGHPYNGNRKEWREWLEEQRKAGKTVITPKMAEDIKGMIIALGNFPLVQQGLLSGAPERSMFDLDPRGFYKKARPDGIPNDSGDFFDLKTTRSVLYRDLKRTIVDYGYDMQGAMVMEVARALGLPAASFTLLFVESKPPYCVRAVTLKDEDLARAHQLNQLAYDIFWQCLQSNHWPGPGDDRPDAEYIDLPDWYRTSVDNRIKYQLREAVR